MSSEWSTAFLLIFITAVCCKNHNDVQSVARGVNKFGDNLYKELAKRSGNIVFSPFSIHSVLALLTLGAGGSTQQQLLSELYLPNIDILKRGYLAIQNEQHKRVEQNPRISSALFVSEDYSLLKKFATIANSVFHAVLQKVKFENPKQAAAIINKRVANETNQTITAVVHAGSLNAGTSMLLLNAIYFKGQWNLKFDKLKTENNFVFHAPKGSVKCNMMVMSRVRHNISFAPNFIFLELSFRDTNIKIAFISLYSSEGLASLERSLDADTLFTERDNLSPMLLELKIPKFKLNAEYSFKHHLISIGLSDIFDSPNFSYLFDVPVPAQVDEVGQKTVLEINEDGAIAATTTKIQLVARSTEIFHQIVLDQPFLFFIYDSKHKMILIKGRVENPAQETS